MFDVGLATLLGICPGEAGGVTQRKEGEEEEKGGGGYDERSSVKRNLSLGWESRGIPPFISSTDKRVTQIEGPTNETQWPGRGSDMCGCDGAIGEEVRGDNDIGGGTHRGRLTHALAALIFPSLSLQCQFLHQIFCSHIHNSYSYKV